MRVVAFGTRPSPFLRHPIGTEGEPLATTELALTLVRTGSQTAVAQFLRVRYTSGEGTKTLNVPYTLTLCSPTDTTRADCRR